MNWNSRLRDSASANAEFEETIEVSRDFFELRSYDEIEVVRTSLHRKYLAVVAELSHEFGQPQFEGGFERPDFPTWYESEFIAFWNHGGKYMYVALRHDDKELPFLLVVGILITENM